MEPEWGGHWALFRRYREAVETSRPPSVGLATEASATIATDRVSRWRRWCELWTNPLTTTAISRSGVYHEPSWHQEMLVDFPEWKQRSGSRRLRWLKARFLSTAGFSHRRRRSTSVAGSGTWSRLRWAKEVGTVTPRWWPYHTAIRAVAFSKFSQKPHASLHTHSVCVLLRPRSVIAVWLSVLLCCVGLLWSVRRIGRCGACCALCNSLSRHWRLREDHSSSHLATSHSPLYRLLPFFVYGNRVIYAIYVGYYMCWLADPGSRRLPLWDALTSELSLSLEVSVP